MSDNNIMDPYGTLPHELLERIFSHLDSINLSTCSQVCKNWRRSFISITGQYGYTPQIMASILPFLDTPALLAVRKTCRLWKLGLDVLTCGQKLSFKARSKISSTQAKEIDAWRKSNFEPHNPFPSRMLQVTLVPNTLHSLYKLETVTNCLTHCGRHVRFLHLKIEIHPTSRPWTDMWKFVFYLAKLISTLQDLVGISIQISSAMGTLPRSKSLSKKALMNSHRLYLNNLKVLRLISWDFSNYEMEWLYFKILKSSPNLEFFDPDFLQGYRKFHRICIDKVHFSFNLKYLKIAISASVIEQFCRYLKQKGMPLYTLFLDIFDYHADIHLSHAEVVKLINYSTKGTLVNLSISFSSDSRFVPIDYFDSIEGGDVGDSHPVTNSNASRATSAMQAIARVLQSKFSNLKDFFYSKRLRLFVLRRNRHRELSSCNLKNLKLKGFKGPLTNLTSLESVERIVLIDYDPKDQSMFETIHKFPNFIDLFPSLLDVSMGCSAIVNERAINLRMVDEKYIPVYW